MADKTHTIYVVSIYNKDTLLYQADTSEMLLGAKFEYDLIDIKNKTGKWPTKIEFMELEKTKEVNNGR